MNAALNKRLSKVEEISARGEIGTEVDRCLEKMPTSRAEMLADFGVNTDLKLTHFFAGHRLNFDTPLMLRQCAGSAPQGGP